MKKIFIYSLSLLIMGTIFTACQDDRINDDQLTDDKAKAQKELDQKEIEKSLLIHKGASQAGLESSLLSTYSLLLGNGGFYSGSSNWLWGSILGGDANKGSNDGDQANINEIFQYRSQANNSDILNKYSILYDAIGRANLTLNSLKIADSDTIVSKEVIKRISAEVRFLRGHYYFEVKKNFNNGPYLDESWDGLAPVPNDQDLWPFIQADFQYAFDNLPETQSEAGRANKWAAAAYLGKALLFQEKYAEAKVMFDNVIANGKTAKGVNYGLLPNYANAFQSSFDNSLESVFSVQAVAGSGNLNNANSDMVLNFPHGSIGEKPGGCCGFFQPSLELANSFRTDAYGLPFLDGSYNSSVNKLVTDLGVTSNTSFTPDNGNLDPRLDHSIGRRDIPYLDWGLHQGYDWIRDQTYGGPYSPKKFVYYKAGIGVENDQSGWTPGYTVMNYNIIRYADVLLMAAEVEVELGNLSKALSYVNQVRSRAAASLVMNNGVPAANYLINNYTSFSSQSTARNAVRFERKLELSGEGHRFYDLVRWNIADQEINKYINNDGAYLTTLFQGAHFNEGKNEYLPIPQSVIDMSDGIINQNPGY